MPVNAQTRIFVLACELGAFLLPVAHGQASWVWSHLFLCACLFVKGLFSELRQATLRTLPDGSRTGLPCLWLPSAADVRQFPLLVAVPSALLTIRQGTVTKRS